MRTTRLRVTLRDVTPTVLRVLDVPSDATLPELHDLLQVGLGWSDTHLHLFDAGDVRYGVPDEDFELEPTVLDESGATLRSLPARFTYLYDFGDGWEHDVDVLGLGAPEPGCVYGEGACPPEDCGGPPGYAELLAALDDPRHDDHARLRTWASNWSADWTAVDQEATDTVVRDMVGRVPVSVRLLLDLLAGGVRLTPGGRLPRVLVRAVQDRRPDWCPWGRPASIEEDLFPLAALHDLLRRVGLARLRHGVLSPTRAAADDRQIVRRLRGAFEPDSFDDVLVGVVVAETAAHGPRSLSELAAAAHPYVARRWAVDGQPVTPDDVLDRVRGLTASMQALDLVEDHGRVLSAGPSARSLIPRATALAHSWRPRTDPSTADPSPADPSPAGDLNGR